MARPLLPDALRSIIAPLLPPPPPPSPKDGRPRLPDRPALTGILFVLRTGRPWEDLPSELNGGCGRFCWRRLRDWQADGTRTRTHAERLARLQTAGKLNGSTCGIDSSGGRAASGGSPPDRTPRTGRTRAASTTSPPARCRGTGRPAAFPASCSATGRIGPGGTRASSAGWASAAPGPPAPANRTAAGWASTAGWSSGPSPAYTRTAASRSGMSGGRTSTKPSSPSPVSSSAGIACAGRDRVSKKP